MSFAKRTWAQVAAPRTNGTALSSGGEERNWLGSLPHRFQTRSGRRAVEKLRNIVRRLPGNKTCPISQEQLRATGTKVFRVIMENGAVIGFDAVALAQYITASGDGLEPTTRRPFTRLELQRLDQVVKSTKPDMPSCVEVVFDPKMQMLAEMRRSLDELEEEHQTGLRLCLDVLGTFPTSTICSEFVLPRFITHATACAMFDGDALRSALRNWLRAEEVEFKKHVRERWKDDRGPDLDFFGRRDTVRATFERVLKDTTDDAVQEMMDEVITDQVGMHVCLPGQQTNIRERLEAVVGFLCSATPIGSSSDDDSDSDSGGDGSD